MARAISFVFLVLAGALLIATTSLQVHAEKEGTCPDLPAAWGAACVELCSSDEGCDGSRKCCSNPCGGHLCLEPIVNGEHPGTCPTVSDTVGGICVTDCENDTDCSYHQKCCHNGCGKKCRSV